MNVFNRIFGLLAICIQFSLLSTNPVAAEEFFHGKRIELIAPASSGGYSNYGLLIAEHWPRHIPGNPTIQVIPMSGAGGIRASNFMATVARKDGTVLYMMHQNAPTVQALTPKRVSYDARQFEPIGIITGLNSVMVTRSTVGVTSIVDAASKPIVLGSTGIGSYTYIVPHLLNRLAGTRFKIIATYNGPSEIILAMERGEIDGFMTSLSTIKQSRPTWIKGDDTARIILQVGAERDPQIPNVQLLNELAANPRDLDIYRFLSVSNSFARSVVAPAGIPEDRLSVLRKSFVTMLGDPQFKLDAAKRGLDVFGSDHVKIKEGIAAIINSPEEVLLIARQ